MLKEVCAGAAVAAGVLIATLLGGTAQAADMSCQGKNFVFFPGGSEGDSFASIVYNGAALAAQQTGCHVEYVWSDWNPELIVQQFSQAIGRSPTGIAVMGHPGDAALDPLIDRARKQGILVTTQNVDLPKAEEKYKGQGFGYVGAKNYSAGENLGDAAVKTCGLKQGDTAFVWGLLGQEARGLRTKGVIDAFKKSGVDVKYLEIADNINKDAAQGIPIFASFMAANPSIKAVVTDHGALTAMLPSYLKAAGKKPGEVCGTGFDLSAATSQGIKDGYITAVLDQQPFLQGYLSIIQLYLTSKFGFAGMDIDTGAAIIDKSNIDAVAPLTTDAIR
ncbi:monosaccharide ABC transporter substrate-binding protein, CUT2 family [Faunimonas pinastri]|uniref:Monosaccharide ABC transporter substrate-binding protein, CUT2 family n=1 Tax=Faunimonas pinastri TaxID=1855383 RepID=A0A1H9LGW6_9HYPH|nr:substrate-binding domain-containing protein [Faunimonas pinastri]SER10654.1 monosaccharide ABC transporter substrate-binding protein, CUT2 family [Faunimonas pinastri]